MGANVLQNFFKEIADKCAAISDLETSLETLREQGIPAYDAAVDYVQYARVVGSDGKLYKALKANGPTADDAQDPVTEDADPRVVWSVEVSDLEARLSTLEEPHTHSQYALSSHTHTTSPPDPDPPDPPLLPQVLAPTNLRVSSITATGAELSWRHNGHAIVFDYEYEHSTGTTAGSLTPKSLSLAGFLSPSTTYTFRVKATKEGSRDSDWVSVQFETQADSD